MSEARCAQKRKAAQLELARKKQEEAAKKYTSDMVQENFDADRSGSKLVVRKSYKSVKEMPSDAVRNRVGSGFGLGAGPREDAERQGGADPR